LEPKDFLKKPSLIDFSFWLFLPYTKTKKKTQKRFSFLSLLFSLSFSLTHSLTELFFLNSLLHTLSFVVNVNVKKAFSGWKSRVNFQTQEFSSYSLNSWIFSLIFYSLYILHFSWHNPCLYPSSFSYQSPLLTQQTLSVFFLLQFQICALWILQFTPRVCVLWQPVDKCEIDSC
jgi:hypothetical protein